MARGHYELPPGHNTLSYGPRRPPTTPNASSITRTSRLSPSSPSPLHSTTQPRARIVILSLHDIHGDMLQSTKIRELLAPHAIVEEVCNTDEAVVAISRRPSAIFANACTLSETMHEPLKLALARYVQWGGTLVTEPSHISSLLERVRG